MHAVQPPHHPSLQIHRQETASPAAPATAPMDAGSPGPAESPEVVPEAPGPLDARYVIVSARFIHEVHPQYPRDAMEQGEQGTVIVLLTAGPQGPSDFRIWTSSGYPSLDIAALEAAKESTYSAPEVNGEPAIETYRAIYTFSLDT